MPASGCVVLSIIVCTVLGIVIEKIAYKPLRRHRPLAVLITAIGVSYLLQNAALLLFGADTKTFPSVIHWQASLAGRTARDHFRHNHCHDRWHAW